MIAGAVVDAPLLLTPEEGRGGATSRRVRTSDDASSWRGTRLL